MQLEAEVHIVIISKSDKKSNYMLTFQRKITVQRKNSKKPKCSSMSPTLMYLTFHPLPFPRWIMRRRVKLLLAANSLQPVGRGSVLTYAVMLVQAVAVCSQCDQQFVSPIHFGTHMRAEHFCWVVLHPTSYWSTCFLNCFLNWIVSGIVFKKPDCTRCCLMSAHCTALIDLHPLHWSIIKETYIIALWQIKFCATLKRTTGRTFI